MYNLILARKRKGLTQKELAKRVGVTNNTISRLERGKTSAKINLMEKIANELEVSIDYLIKDDFYEGE